MKGKTLSIIMLALILINAVSVAFTSQISMAENLKNNALKTESLVNQNETLQSSVNTSADDADKWNFQTNEWTKFAYKNGNNTRLVVGLENTSNLQKLETIASKYEARIVSTVTAKTELMAAVVELPCATVTALVVEIHRIGLASYVEPDMKVQAQFFPNDPYWSYQWNLQKIEADWAWNTTVGDHSILVAVTDTGIDYSHHDIAPNYVALGYDWANMDSDPQDDHGHGTHCAGIIAAVLNNSIGIAGLAQVQVMAEKVLDFDGVGYSNWIANGIIHATDCGAKIISMSFGGYGESEIVQEAVKYAYNAGVLLIAAAGNDDTSVKFYPAAYDQVVAVAATNESDTKAEFSNWGTWIELSAPGVNITSTVLSGYESWSGTSMAAPLVAGLAALVWSYFPNRTRDWVRLWLRYTTDDLGSPGFDKYYGYGRINARKAIEMASQVRELVAYEWDTPPYLEPNSFGMINATVLNLSYSNETNVTVQLFANNTLTDSITIGFVRSGSSATVSLTWNPFEIGTYNITVYVVPLPDETDLTNNFLTKYVDVGYPVKAVVLHSAGNVFSEIIANWQALNSEWRQFGNVMIHIDYTTLNKDGITYADIASTNADVLIISSAYDASVGWQFTDSEIQAIKQYVQEGHGLIATGGTFYYGVPNNNKLAPLFGMNETIMWDTSGTSLMRLQNMTHPLFRNVPNPFNFPNVATAIPFDKKWDSSELASGEYLALGDSQESAIVTYRNLVYISPWLEVIPPYYIDHLQLLYNAITLSRYKKPQHEIVVSLETPRHLLRGQYAILNAIVTNLGLSDEANVELYLSIDEETVSSTIIPKLLAGQSRTISHPWTPSIEKVYRITAYSPIVPSEELTDDNVDSALVNVRSTMFVLWDNTKDADGDSLTRNYESLYSLLTTNGFAVDELNYGIIDSTVLANYDIFVLMDPEIDFWESEIRDIQNWVSTGGALVVLPDGGYPSTTNTLLAPYGVRVTGAEGSYGTVKDIAEHPITQDVNSIWVNLVREISVTSPSKPLAWTTESLAFLSATEDGEVVVLSDSNIMDDEGLGKNDNTQLTLNIFNWVGTKPNHDVSVLLEAPAFVGTGTSKMLNATVRNRGLSNETNVNMFLLINDTVVDSVQIPELQAGESYTLRYAWTPLSEGRYNVTAYVSPLSDEALLTNNIVIRSVFVSHTGGTYVFIDPLESSLSVGQTLTLKVRVAYVVNLYAWQVKIYYDSSILSFLNATYPSNHVFEGKPFFSVDPYNSSDQGGAYIMFFACLAGSQSGFSGSGTLCQISFTAVKNGVSELLFSKPLGWDSGDTWLVDPSLTDISFTVFDGRAEVIQPPDIAVTGVYQFPAETYERWIIQINISVQNLGGSDENFTVTVHYDDVEIAKQEVANFAPNEGLTLTFIWNLSHVPLYVNYTVWAEASVIPGELNTGNNIFLLGYLIVKKTGDVNCDRDVNGLDLAIVCKAFASELHSPRWNSKADMTQDNKIDGRDIAICAKNFMR